MIEVNMRKYKIAVYAICKNEEKYIEQWVSSMSEADSIFVLDTGSTDNSVLKLKELNVNVVSQIINPWRFDVARNRSLELVPEDFDICVCTDFDEIFHKGWREIIEEKWLPNTKQLKYRYTWNFNSNGSEGTVFL
jgi:Glycosyl transferase family 2.